MTGFVDGQTLTSAQLEARFGQYLATGALSSLMLAFVTTSTPSAALNALGVAALASPTFTGSPAGPTPATSDNSTLLATTAFVKACIAALAAGMVFQGVIDASASPNYPAGNKGDVYRISVAGKIGGASGINVENGDMLFCQTNSTASGNQATVGAQWDIVQANIDGAVVGPTSAVDNTPAVYSGTTGKLIKNITYAAFKTAMTLVSADITDLGTNIAAALVIAANAANGLVRLDSSGKMPAVDGSLLKNVLGPHVIIEEQYASGTTESATSSGAALNLNTVVYNAGSLASLSSKQITLPAGTYYITFYNMNDGGYQTKPYLYNVTDSANAIVGMSGYSGGGTNTHTAGGGIITISASKVFELRLYRASANYGYPASSGLVEIFTHLEITKIG